MFIAFGALPAVKILPVVVDTTDQSPTSTTDTSSAPKTNDIEGTSMVVYDPLVHWSDVTPTMELPPPPTASASAVHCEPTDAKNAPAHTIRSNRHEDLETFANDMEHLGDFLMDAMADGEYNQDDHNHRHEQQQEQGLAYTEMPAFSTSTAFYVEEPLEPPPLLLPPVEA